MIPQDQLTVYGCAFAEQELGDIEPALKHFQAALEMEAPDALRGLAFKWAARDCGFECCSSGDLGWMWSFCLLDALLFCGKLLRDIQ